MKINIKLNANIGKKSLAHVANFCYICDKYLEYPHGTYQVELIDKRENDMTTASYDPNTHKVKVFCGNRLVADVLRSIAHELVHHKQNLSGELHYPVQDIGGKIEDEANALAGRLVKIYCKRLNNKEAYNLPITE